MWRVERQNRNAELIASRRGALLYEKFANFVNDMMAIETNLNRAQKSLQRRP